MEKITLSRDALTRLQQFCEGDATAPISVRQEVGDGEFISYTRPPNTTVEAIPELCAVVSLADIRVLSELAKNSDCNYFLLDALFAGDPQLDKFEPKTTTQVPGDP